MAHNFYRKLSNRVRVFKNFTMIELLIVITIFFILISLLSPSLKNILNQANNVSCHNNLKQVYVSSYQYTLDNDNILVPVSQGPSFSRKAWMWALAPYLGFERQENNPHTSVEVTEREANNLMCPSAVDVHLDTYGNTFRITTYAYNFYSGFRNRYVLDRRKTFYPVNLNNISKPDKAYLLLDGSGFMYRYDYFRLGTNGLGNPYLYRHLNGQNRLAADGHLQYAIGHLDVEPGSFGSSRHGAVVVNS